MKKIIALLSVFTLLVSSCASDETAAETPVDTNTTGVLVKKIIETDVDGSFTTNYFYNGNKILKCISDDGETNFTYTGNLITSIEDVSDDGYNSINTFTYNTDEKLTSFSLVDVNSGIEIERKSYEYNTDGTVIVSNYGIGFFDDAGAPYIFAKEKLFFENNEVVKVERTSYAIVNGVQEATGPATTTNYSFDSKNNPFKNVIGIANITFNEGFLFLDGRFSNILSRTSVGTPNIDTYQYNYNSLNFPVSSTYETYNDGNGSFQFFYE